MLPSPPYIVGNWKMHGDARRAHQLTRAIAAQASGGGTVILCPPFPLLPAAAEAMQGSRLHLGAQDCSPHGEGAFTGDVSAAMLKDAGCGYVIVGHSERRQHHKESDAEVSAKASAALGAGLTPIVCIGETQVEREVGRAEETVERQIEASLPSSPRGEETVPFILAYEPVWAIGTGKTATPEDISRMHALIKTRLSAKTWLAGRQISVLYGGSVNAANARAILALRGVDGVLVGGASLKAEEFISILRAA